MGRRGPARGDRIVTDTTLIERAKVALKIVGDDTWSLTPQETYDGRSTTRYYRVMDQNLNAICCEEYGAHCDGGEKKMHLIALAPDLARALIREREAAEVEAGKVAAWYEHLLDAAESMHKDGGAELHRLIRNPPRALIEGKTDE
jgi:hypothetical protein